MVKGYICFLNLSPCIGRGESDDNVFAIDVSVYFQKFLFPFTFTGGRRSAIGSRLALARAVSITSILAPESPFENPPANDKKRS